VRTTTKRFPKILGSGKKAIVFGTGYLVYPVRQPDSHVHHRYLAVRRIPRVVTVKSLTASLRY
jgi:hypothetical protein